MTSPSTPSVASTPIPATSPPVTPSSADVVQAQQDLRRQALKKKGFAQTYKAGDTGGYYPGNLTASPTNKGTNFASPAPSPGAKTLGT